MYKLPIEAIAMPDELNPEAAAPTAETAPPPQPVILLVEDEEPIRELIGMALSGRGYQVHVCPLSNDAVAQAEAMDRPPDLLITDIHMAGLSGPELAAELVQRYPRLRLLFISGYANTNDQVQAAMAFAHAGFLRKPFSLAQFRENVDAMLK